MDFDDLSFPDDYDPFAPAPVNNPTTNTDTTTNESSLDNTKDTKETKSKRIRKVRLDETLLLSPKGLSRIRYEGPFLQFKGRGHEAEDLTKLMRYYQLWAHNLYPRLRFQDFVSRVVKVTPKKRCRVSLTEWQKEYKDRMRERRLEKEAVEDEFSGMTIEDDENTERRIDDLNAEIFGGGNNNNNNSNNSNNSSSSSGPSAPQQERDNQPRERTIIDKDDDDNDTEMDQDDASSNEEEDDQPLFMKPKPRQTSQQEEEESPLRREERRKQKDSRADALAALLARRKK